VLRPSAEIDVAQLVRAFTLRTSEGFVETFGAGILDRVGSEAPRVQLRFMQKPHKDSAALREGSVDLETGVVDDTTGPEVRTQALFRDRWVGVARAGHALSRGRVTAERFASGKHISVWRGAPGTDPVDRALRQLGLEREIVAFLAGGFAAAIALARSSELIVAVPEHQTGRLRSGMHSFALPVAVPEFTISLLWHPRLDADGAHRWLRACIRDVCTKQLEQAARVGGSKREQTGARRRARESAGR
jgi:DNA-binding transcriptional LysR family regulator